MLGIMLDNCFHDNMGHYLGVFKPIIPSQYKGIYCKQHGNKYFLNYQLVLHDAKIWLAVNESVVERNNNKVIG